MPTTKAVRIREPGDATVLTFSDVTVRDPGPNELLVEVAAAGVNRADILQRRGVYPAPPGAPTDIPGLEYAGHVAAVGSEVSAWKPGDRVMGVVGGGGYARHLVVHEREAIAVPAGLSDTDAAAIPEAFVTAWDALFGQAKLAVGEHVLIHAIASGVGTAALQLALAAGARVIGTSRSREKLDRCAAYGLTQAVVCDEPKFAADVQAMTDGRGADVVLDTIGASYFDDNVRALAPRGRLVLIGMLGGATASAPLGLILAKRVTVIGSVLRSRPLEEKATLAQAFSRQVVPLFTTGKLRPVVGEVLPMADVREAHRRMESNETFGKLVLAW